MTDTPQLLLAHHLKALKLPTFLREYDKLARQCAAEGLDHIRFLLRLAELELIDRERRMVERWIKEARFPAVKSLDSFDFAASSTRRGAADGGELRQAAGAVASEQEDLDMPVTPLYLLQGAWYALEQCGLLLRDANVLYRSSAYASAVVLTAFAREELGRSSILLDLWQRAIAGEDFTTGQIREACVDHETKQRAGMLSLTMRADRESRLGKLLAARMIGPH
jgi:hypothetical protein